jgi:inorganic triphosphatase YgiF
MIEIELKFQVPMAALAGVRRDVAIASAHTQRLRTVYVDTADGRLAAAGVALRLRRDGRRWLQTFKASGDGLLQRIEHEVPVPAPPRGCTPALDLARHDGTPAGARLRAALAEAAALGPVFETVVRRTRRVVRVGGTRVELALDEGEIRAGARRLPLCEVEFEWLSGPLDGLFQLADRWVSRHGLWLDVRSKSERGALLARGEAAAPAVMAQRPPLRPDQGPDAALRAMVGAGLGHLLPNAAAVAGGQGGPEHLHQVRVALRRLRTALKVFGGWSAAAAPGWEAALAELFDALGAARDRDALAASLLPALRAAGAPLADLGDADTPAADPGAALRALAANRLLLALLAFAAGPPLAEDASVAARAQPLLKRLHRQVMRDGERFLDLDDEARHRARRRVKRLRYAADFVAALWPARDVKRYLARLAPAQDALGRFNDLCVAEQAFRARAAQDPRAWFAVGWITARRAECIGEAARALRRLSRAKPFWQR